MPLVKVSELEGDALDWAVEEAQGYGNRYLEFWRIGGDKRFIFCQVGHSPSTHWSQGGPIIERERIILLPPLKEDAQYRNLWEAGADYDYNWMMEGTQIGPTPLIAAMRCYVASKLGESIEIPEELT